MMLMINVCCPSCCMRQVRALFPGGPHDVPVDHLNETDLINRASRLLERKHLAPAAGLATWPVNGRLYGLGRRPLVCLPTSYKNNPLTNVIYLVDMCAPTTRLSARAFEALGLRGDVLVPVTVNINGSQHVVELCEPKSHHADIPILGADTMVDMGLQLFVDYTNRSVVLRPRVGVHCCDCGIAWRTQVLLATNQTDAQGGGMAPVSMAPLSVAPV